MPKYNILHEYVKQIKFDSPLAPDLFVLSYKGKSMFSTTVDVETQSLEQTRLFCVYLKLKCTVELEDGRSPFSVNVCYGVLVGISEILEKQELKQLLTIEIPQIVYPHLATLVQEITAFSGYNPIVLPDYSFVERKLIETEPSVSNESDDELLPWFDGIPLSQTREYFEDEPESILTLKKILADIESEKEGKEFLETLKQYGGEIRGFNDFILTRTLFQYLSYVDYHVSKEIEQDDYAKQLMYYLVVASSACSWRLSKESGNQTELWVKCEDDDFEKKISDLSQDDFFKLGTDLAVNVLTGLYVDLFPIEQSHGPFLELSQHPSQDEYREAFNYDALSEQQQELVDSLYDKILKTQLEVFALDL